MQFKKGMITGKPLTLLGSQFSLHSRLVVNLSSASKGASMTGLLKKNKDWPTMTKKISTPAKSKIQLKNDERGSLRLNSLRVVQNHHRQKAKNLPVELHKTSVVNVEVLGIMLQLARNRGGNIELPLPLSPLLP